MGLFNFAETEPQPGYEKVECYNCDGSGKEECDCTGGLGPKHADDDCYMCGGTGIRTCVVCRGHGYIYEK